MTGIAQLQYSASIPQDVLELYTRRKLDVDLCIPIQQKLSSLDAIVNNVSMPFEHFIDNCSVALARERFSTEPLTKKSLENMPSLIAPFFRPLFLSHYKGWELLVYREEQIGISVTTSAYNGFPSFLDTNAFLNDPHGTYHIMCENLTEILKIANPLTLFVPPEKAMKREVRVLPDFLKKYTVYDRSTKERVQIHS
jgi:hypothetical protein